MRRRSPADVAKARHRPRHLSGRHGCSFETFGCDWIAGILAMTAGMVSLYALATMLGVAPAILRTTLTRAGVKLKANDRASEDDLARVFGTEAAREFVRRAGTGRRLRRP